MWEINGLNMPIQKRICDNMFSKSHAPELCNEYKIEVSNEFLWGDGNNVCGLLLPLRQFSIVKKKSWSFFEKYFEF